MLYLRIDENGFAGGDTAPLSCIYALRPSEWRAIFSSFFPFFFFTQSPQKNRRGRRRSSSPRLRGCASPPHVVR